MTTAPTTADAPTLTSADPGGRRWYTHPVKQLADGVHERWISVTTVIDTAAKNGLVPWAGGGAAASMADGIPGMLAAMLIPECGLSTGDGSKDRCRKCAPCLVRWHGEWHLRESERASHRGISAHFVLRHWTQFGVWIDHDPEWGPWIGQLKQFVRDFKLTPKDVVVSEATVISRDGRGYAGTLDLILDVDPSRSEHALRFCARVGVLSGRVRTLIDLKTTLKEERTLYETMALQLAPYRRAQHFLLDDGTEHPMVETDAGAILQVGPGWYALEPVRCDGTTYAGFVALRDFALWLVEHGPRSVGVSAFPVPDEVAGTVAGNKRIIQGLRAAGRRDLLVKEADRRQPPSVGICPPGTTVEVPAEPPPVMVRAGEQTALVDPSSDLAVFSPRSRAARSRAGRQGTPSQPDEGGTPARSLAERINGRPDDSGQIPDIECPF